MPIRRPSNNDADFMARKMDKRLLQMEASISNVYGEASVEAQRELKRYLARYEEQRNVMNARLIEGEITQVEYDRWIYAHMLRTQRYEALIESLTDVLLNADITAMAVIDGELPYIIAQSYNFTQFAGNMIAESTGLSVGTFQIYNTRTVEAIFRMNPRLIPVVDIPVDRRWNNQHINTALTQGLLRGDSMDGIAARLQTVIHMDDNSAIRTARTATTAAENYGRNISYNRIRSQGINMEKKWNAQMDNRTRDTHLLLNDTKPNEEGYFGEGILNPNHLMQYPADPNGEPQEVYNCRCRLDVLPPEMSRRAVEEDYTRWMRENYPEDLANIREYDNRKDGANEQRQAAIERLQRLRRERSG